MPHDSAPPQMPAVPMPPPAPDPVPGTSGYGQVPGQKQDQAHGHQAALAGAPAAQTPGRLGLVANALAQVPLAIWRGNVVGALAFGASVRDQTRATWMWWTTVFLTNALLIGLIVATSVSRSVSEASGFFGDLTDSITGGFGGSFVSSKIGISFGTLVGIFLTFMVLAAGSLLVRALFLRLVFAVRRTPVTFPTVADITATAQSVYTFPLIAMLLISFFPIGLRAILVPVVALIMAGLAIISETTTYIGINRTARFTKSPLVPYATMTLLSFGAIGIFFIVVMATTW